MSKKRTRYHFSNKQIFYVYALIDSLNDEIFYIGKGSGKRITSHLRNYFRGKRSYNPKKDARIRKIYENGGKVIHKKLKDNLFEEEAFRLEEKYIRYFGLKQLTNLTYGGVGGIKSDTVKKNLIGKNNPNYGNRWSQEQRDNLSRKLRGKHPTKETRKKLSISAKKRTEKCGLPWTGKKLSEERRKRISEIGKGRKVSEETRKKISEAKINGYHPYRGKKLSEEHIRKMLETRKKYYSIKENRNKVSKKIEVYFNGKLIKTFYGFKKAFRNKFFRKVKNLLQITNSEFNSLISSEDGVVYKNFTFKKINRIYDI